MYMKTTEDGQSAKDMLLAALREFAEFLERRPFQNEELG